MANTARIEAANRTMRAQWVLRTDHPILRNHTAYGQALLPGLAYIDLLFQFFRQRGFDYRELELRKLSIYQPLIVGPDFDVLLDVECVESATGAWQISIDGRERRPGSPDAWPYKRYITVEMHRVAPTQFSETLDLAELDRARAVFDLEDIYSEYRQMELVHEGFIKAQGHVHETPEATYMDLSLGEEASASAGQFMFHPTLIDGSTIGMARLASAVAGEEKRLFLPLFYGSFRASHLLQRHSWTRIGNASVQRRNELIHIAMDFFDAEGRMVAELRDYVIKLVRVPGLINPSRTTKNTAPARAATSEAAVDSTAVDVLLRQLLARKLNVSEASIDARSGYYEMGLSSARLLELVREIEERVDASLSPTLLFEYPTLAELSTFLTQTYGARLAPTKPASATPAVAKQPSADPATLTAAPSNTGDIAVIGMAGRYPGANNLREFWNNLLAGKDCVDIIPESRWPASTLAGITSPSGKVMSRWGGFISDPECFDPQFFRISPREAAALDPQERLFLEVCWEAIEDAGYRPDTLTAPVGRHRRHPVGVFAGVMHKDYSLLQGDAVGAGALVPMSLSNAMIANRVSYVCNFHGPSIALDTVCSSSLTALHLALESIRSGECRVALAGGVNLSLHPAKYLTYGLMDMHASDGRCRTFGEGGDGYVSSEGVGAVVLKPLAQALQDNDTVYAVIKGSTINHGGRASGMTVPNPVAQAEMIEACLEKTGIPPRTVTYVEAHGTGTSLGDPIEIQGLVKAFGGAGEERQFCALGSVKSNIGHAESAAGVAGLTKVILQLRHRTLVPSLHSATTNPHIHFENTPFYVQRQAESWAAPIVTEKHGTVTYPRRAGLSSFGATGSNAHVILEESPQSDAIAGRPANEPVLIVLSAKNEGRLQAVAQRLLDIIEPAPMTAALYADENLIDIAYTLQVGRVEMEHRLAIVARSTAELSERLRAYLAGTRMDRSIFVGVADGSVTVSYPNAAEDLAGQHYSAVAEQWVKGAAIDWRPLYEKVSVRRVSLPTYPFERQRYWVAQAERKLQPVAAAAVVANEPSPVDPPAPMEQLTEQVPPLREELQRELKESFAAAIYLAPEQVEVRKPFVEMGLDSIVGVEWIRAINSKYQLNIPATRLYDYPNIQAFARFLSELLGSRSERVQPGGVVEQRQQEPTPAMLQPPTVRAANRTVNAVAAAQGKISLLPLSETQSGGVELAVETGLAALRPLGAVNASKETLGDDDYGVVIPSVQRLDEVTLTRWRVPAPDADEVTIAVKASAINFPDSLCVSGLYPTLPEYPFVPGFEVAGVIVALGSNARGYQLGDEVIAVTGPQLGGHAARVNVPVASTVRKPVNLSFEQACCLPVAFLTAYAAFEAAALSPGEHVLVHTATGGCGLLALQLANLQHCVVYGTSSREQKLTILERLQVAYALNYRERFDQALLELTSGRGVDVVLNMLSGEAIQKGLNCLAPSGRYVELAVHALKSGVALDLSRLVDNQSLLSIDLRRLGKAGKFDLQAGLQRMVEMVEAGHIVPIVSRVYPIAQFREALAFVSQGQHIGKVVVSHTQNAMTDVSAECIDRMLAHRWKCASSAPMHLFKPVAKAAQPARADGIAIVGVSGQFPSSPTLEAFWDNLAQGVDCVTRIPESRWSLQDYYAAEPGTSGKTYSGWMGALEDIDKFDPLFFGISPAEAKIMDPQQRLFLENCWHCLEDAGIDPARIAGSATGVFVGCTPGDYTSSRGDEHSLSAQGLMGVSSAMLAARIAYVLDLKGPNMAIDTACSASLVAISEACNSLLLGTSDLALAGGVCILCGPDMHIMTSQAGMLSKDGRCFTFDRRANGFVPGEGVGVVLLKRLSDAERDGDRILGVIRGWGVNQDGRTNGITAPSAVSQTKLEREVYERFGIDPQTITMAEAHGTGTELGDPIEVEALNAAFRSYTQRREYCALGSVKSNIGHLLAAAGISGVIKVLLAIQHRALPPTINFTSLNPHISLDDSPFFINTRLQPWDSPVPRRACVSSFGFSGTNAHLVIEEYVSQAPRIEAVPAQPQLIVLSARNKERLRAHAGEMSQYLAAHSALTLADVAYTLQVGREAMEERCAFAVSSMQELIASLRRLAAGEPVADEIDPTHAYSAAAVSRWLAQGNLPELAAAWSQGGEVDWRQLARANQPRRVRLPGYPFVRRRCWIESEQRPANTAIEAPTARAQPRKANTAAQLQALRASLSESFAHLLSLEPDELDAEKTFVELGMDSIVGVEWVKLINRQFDAGLKAAHLYDHPTIDALAKYLSELVSVPAEAAQESPTVAPLVAVEEPSIQPAIGALAPKSERACDIAIVGMSGRYPGASNLDQLWDNLAAGRNSVREIPAHRWNVEEFYEPAPGKPGKSYCKWLGVLDDIECFDPLFFNISPLEAERMDPQQRLFLQEAYKAFEDAGYGPKQLNNARCGVYFGIMNNDFSSVLARCGQATADVTGNSYSIAAARVAYHLNLQGPAIAIDTACSSSLVATHLACQALARGEIDMAVVGGATLYLDPQSFVGMCGAGMLSPDGLCKTFDDGANGFVPGDGVGALVLKRLNDAERDRDPIHGVIIGSGINQDGKTNGITAPSSKNQMALEQDVYRRHGIDPSSISYAEFHGTGTQLGDPIELEALAAAFRSGTGERKFCAIGSVKSNLGHTSAAAGVVGVQKVLLAMKHRKLVPTLNFATPNSHFDFESSPFYVNTSVQDWQSERRPRRACVSSFGYSGTNAHLVIEEYPPRADAVPIAAAKATKEPALIVLSARTSESLRAQAKQLRAHLRAHAGVNLTDLAHTLQVGRAELRHRLAIVALTKDELLDQLSRFLEPAATEKSGTMFTGEASRKPEGGLFEADPDAAALLQTWLSKKRLDKLASLWVKGIAIDWERWYSQAQPRRINLPTYPFSQERYWPTPLATATAPASGASSWLHPLLHRNTSDLTEQRYSSTFTGEEFFLADHRVGTSRVLPGVAYLEMARAAAVDAMRLDEEEGAGVRLKNVTWLRPLVVSEPSEVHIGLALEADERISFEVYSHCAEEAVDEIVYCQGHAEILEIAAQPRLDLGVLRDKCVAASKSIDDYYSQLEGLGLSYGPAHRALQEIRIGGGGVLARLMLPDSLAQTHVRYALHPSLLDAALQASIALSDSSERTNTGVVPFVVAAVDVWHACTIRMWAWLRAGASGAIDIDLCDETGQVCCRLAGFRTRPLAGEKEPRRAGSALDAEQSSTEQRAAVMPRFAT